MGSLDDVCRDLAVVDEEEADQAALDKRMSGRKNNKLMRL
jgi:hypothetical protein